MKKYFITAGVIIVLIINLIIMYVLLKAKVESNQNNFQYTPLSEEQKTHVEVQGATMLIRTYTGEVDTTYITNKLDNLANSAVIDLYNDVKNLSDTELSNYFTKNKTTINSNFGISDLTTFKKLVNCALRIEKTNQKCKSSTVNLENYQEKNGYATFIQELVFDNNVTLKFNIQISMSRKSTNALIKIIPAE